MSPLSTIKRVAEAVFNALRPTIRTHIIGQVVSYDPAANTATIQPVLKIIRSTDANNTTTIQCAPLADVPVRQYGSGKVWVTIAPAVGSYGELHVSDRAIDGWSAAGGIVEPTSTRTHDISDAIFEPSIVPTVDDGDNGAFAVAIATDRVSLRTRTGKTEISVLDDETVYATVNDGAATVTVDVDGNIDVATDGDINATAAGDVTIDCDGAASVTAGGDITLAADGNAVTSAAETVLQDGTDYAVQYTALKSAFDTLKTDLNNFVTWATTHVHPGVLAGAASTAVSPVPPVQSTADMAGSKVSDVRVP